MMSKKKLTSCSVILADEMGLGKTIQIISMIASLVKDNPKVYFPIRLKIP